MTAAKARKAILEACQKAQKKGLKICAHGFVKYDGPCTGPRVLAEVCPIGAVVDKAGKLKDAASGGYVRVAEKELDLNAKQVWQIIDGVDYANRPTQVEANKRHPYFMVGVAVARALNVVRK